MVAALLPSTLSLPSSRNNPLPSYVISTPETSLSPFAALPRRRLASLIKSSTTSKGCAEKGSLSKEDAAFICVEALEVVPQGGGFIFEVINGEEKVSNWKECLTRLMEEGEGA